MSPARSGSLAQLGEHLPYKQRVIGSSPIVSTSGLVVQLVRTLPCHGRGRGFEPHPGRCIHNRILFMNGILAQLGEHLPYKQRVIGSSPIGPT